jgi:histo-blood group ABO system transferase
MPLGEGMQYFAGGFYGGEYSSFVQLLQQLVEHTARDAAKGITAIFHDESQLNRLFWLNRPDVVLSPAYLYPEMTTTLGCGRPGFHRDRHRLCRMIRRHL